MARTFSLCFVVVLGGCSLIRNPGDFTIVDGGADGTMDSSMGCTSAASCPTRPNAAATCSAGECIYDCATGFDDCDGDDANGCEASLRAAATCGSCGVSCAMGELCDSTGTAPVCSTECAGTVCGTECVDTSTNPMRCGDCTTSCTVPAGAAEATCSGGTCGFTCLAGAEDCNAMPGDGCEVDTVTDLAHCGGCGVACDATNVETQSCDMSACTIGACTAGFDDCNTDAVDGCEVDLATDTVHCGSCGNACAAGTTCMGGVCDPVVQVARGITHGCAVRESGRVVCWGGNDSGQSGFGSVGGLEAPATVRVDTSATAADFLAARVATASSHTCAIDRTLGKLWCWGAGGRLGAGDGVGNTPVPQAVVAETETALFDSRTFDVVALQASHSCAIDDAGAVWCWGPYTNGAVPGTGFAYSARRVAGLPGAAIDVVVTNDASCAVLADGTAWCWGTNSVGQLGNGDSTGANSETPVQVMGITDATRITGYWRTFCTLDSAGELSCWGDNTSGQIGPTGSGTLERAPVVVESSGVLDVWQSLFSLCYRKSDGVYCKGRNTESQWGNGMNAPGTTNTEPPARVPELDRFRDIVGGRRGACGIDGGEGYCWGASYEGGVPRDTLLLEAPGPVSDSAGTVETGFTDVAAGPNHTCAVRTGLAHCWGLNGIGTLGDRSQVVRSHPAPVDDLMSVIDVTVGTEHGCAIDDGAAGRQAWCWGANTNFELGSSGGTTAAPRQVAFAGVEIAIESGSHHTCAITASNGVVCWGANSQGQLGRAASTRELPAAVGAYTDVSALALGHLHSCALRTGGTVECWGGNGSGQLGDGTTTASVTPVAVPGLTGATAIAAGNAHTCALQSTGQVRCWGANFIGQLGNASMTSSPSPVLVDYSAMPAVAISAGQQHSCAAYADGSVRCWGDGQLFQTGTGTTAAETSPAVVPGLTAVTALSSRSEAGHLTCALQGDASPPGSIRCWGRNHWGAAGQGETIHHTPVLLVLP